MRFSVYKLSKAILFGAALLIAVEWIKYFQLITFKDFPLVEQFLSTMVRCVLYGGGLAALAAIVWLLAEIRDALRSRNSETPKL